MSLPHEAVQYATDCNHPVPHPCPPRPLSLTAQGSTNFDHWAINFNFEPVLFEDPSLGARIHRGVYEAALRLYDDLLPLVRQHLATSPSATVCFAGHSLGGSLSTVSLVRSFLSPGGRRKDS